MVTLFLHLKGKWKRGGGCWGGEMGSSPHKGWRAKGQGWVIVAGAPGVFSSEGGVKGEASCFSPDLFSWRNTFKNTFESKKLVELVKCKNEVLTLSQLMAKVMHE